LVMWTERPPFSDLAGSDAGAVPRACHKRTMASGGGTWQRAAGYSRAVLDTVNLDGWTGGKEYEVRDDTKDPVYVYTDERAESVRDEVFETLDGALAEEEARLKELLPYTTEEGEWAWLEMAKGRDPTPCIWSVLVLLFATWTEHAFGVVTEGGEWKPLRLWFPVTPCTEGGVVHRAQGHLCYTHPSNAAVYGTLKMTISDVVLHFIETLKEIGAFSSTSTRYIIPAVLHSKALINILVCLVGSNSSIATPSGGLPSSFGLQRLAVPSRHVRAVGNKVLTFHQALHKQQYEAHIAKGNVDDAKEWLPLISLSEPDEGCNPSIPEGAMLPAFDMEKFEAFIDAANKSVVYYASELFPSKPHDALRDWIAAWALDHIHEIAPHFTAMIGVQYSQSVCKDLQSSSARANFDSRPRAYHAADPRYRAAVTKDQAIIWLQFLYCMAIGVISPEKYIIIMSGIEGSGKSLSHGILTLLLGGESAAYRLDDMYGQFSTSMLTKETTHVVVEDSSDGAVNIPANLMDAAVGAREGFRKPINKRAKYAPEEKIELDPTSIFVAKNEPALTKEQAERALKMSPIDAMCKAVYGEEKGGNGGRKRRSVIAPPQMETVAKGTVNPVDVDGNEAFDMMALLGKEDERNELAYILVLLWAIETMAWPVTDDLMGMLGNPMSKEASGLFDTYLMMVMDRAQKKVDTLQELVAEVPYKLEIKGSPGTIFMQQGLSRNRLEELWRAKTDDPLGDIPSFIGAPDEVAYCVHCNMAFFGKPKDKKIRTTDDILAVLATSQDLQKSRVKRVCPVETQTRCIESLVVGRIWVGWGKAGFTE